MTRACCKVAVTGAHSTGKSTFVACLRNELLKRGVEAESVHTSATKAQALGFPILSEHTFESTAWMMAEAIQQEALAALRSKVILVDRPVPDALGYFIAALSHSGRAYDEGQRERLVGICESWIGDYDLVVLTEIDASVALGADRDTDKEFREAAGQAIKEVVKGMARNCLILQRGQEQDAVKVAVDLIVERVSGT